MFDTLNHLNRKCNTILHIILYLHAKPFCITILAMITKQDLLNHLGGTYTNVARKLGYAHVRADNNISRLPGVLTERQLAVIIMRMRARRIKVPAHWIGATKAAKDV